MLTWRLLYVHVVIQCYTKKNGKIVVKPPVIRCVSLQPKRRGVSHLWPQSCGLATLHQWKSLYLGGSSPLKIGRKKPKKMEGQKRKQKKMIQALKRVNKSKVSIKPIWGKKRLFSLNTPEG